MKKLNKSIPNIYPAVFGLLFLLACGKPEDIPPTTIDEDPEYYARFGLDGSLVEFKAGVDSIYLQAEANAANSGIIVYSSGFLEAGCQSSCSSFLVELTDLMGEVDFQPGQLLGLENGEFEYAKPSIMTSSFFLTAHLISDPLNQPNFTWIVNGATQFTNDTLLLNLDPGQPFSICIINSTPAGGCFYQQCISSSAALNSSPCFTKVEATLDSNFLQLEAFPSGIPPFSYTWNTGDTTRQLNFALNTLDSVIYSLTVTDAMGCESVIESQQVLIEGIYSDCSVDIAFGFEEGPGIQNPQYSSFALTYIDEGGGIYRSDLVNQSNTAYFFVEETEELEITPPGKTGKKAKVSFSCDLASANGGIVEIRDGEAVIAFSRDE